MATNVDKWKENSFGFVILHDWLQLYSLDKILSIEAQNFAIFQQLSFDTYVFLLANLRGFLHGHQNIEDIDGQQLKVVE